MQRFWHALGLTVLSLVMVCSKHAEKPSLLLSDGLSILQSDILVQQLRVNSSPCLRFGRGRR